MTGEIPATFFDRGPHGSRWVISRIRLSILMLMPDVHGRIAIQT